MTRKPPQELQDYNLEGGQRRLVLCHGEVKAVAPGLRLVEATAEEKEPFERRKAAKKKPLDYGLPV